VKFRTQAWCLIDLTISQIVTSSQVAIAYISGSLSLSRGKLPVDTNVWWNPNFSRQDLMPNYTMLRCLRITVLCEISRSYCDTVKIPTNKCIYSETSQIQIPVSIYHIPAGEKFVAPVLPKRLTQNGTDSEFIH